LCTRCHAYVRQCNNYVIAQNRLSAKLRQTLTDPDKILQAYVGRTKISHVKLLVPWAKWAKMAAKKVGVFTARAMLAL